MFDLLFESSHRDDSNKRKNIGFGQEIMDLALIEVYFTHLIWSSEPLACQINCRLLNFLSAEFLGGSSGSKVFAYGTLVVISE